jgi:hypothetical protein
MTFEQKDYIREALKACKERNNVYFSNMFSEITDKENFIINNVSIIYKNNMLKYALNNYKLKDGTCLIKLFNKSAPRYNSCISEYIADYITEDVLLKNPNLRPFHINYHLKVIKKLRWKVLKNHKLWKEHIIDNIQFFQSDINLFDEQEIKEIYDCIAKERGFIDAKSMIHELATFYNTNNLSDEFIKNYNIYSVQKLLIEKGTATGHAVKYPISDLKQLQELLSI